MIDSTRANKGLLWLIIISTGTNIQLNSDLHLHVIKTKQGEEKSSTRTEEVEICRLIDAFQW